MASTSFNQSQDSTELAQKSSTSAAAITVEANVPIEDHAASALNSKELNEATDSGGKSSPKSAVETSPYCQLFEEAGRTYWLPLPFKVLRATEVLVYETNTAFSIQPSLTVLERLALKNVGRGFHFKTMGLVMRNDDPHFYEQSTDTIYRTVGEQSLSLTTIFQHILEFKQVALDHPNLTFIVHSFADIDSFGNPLKHMSGYTPHHILSLYQLAQLPPNVILPALVHWTNTILQIPNLPSSDEGQYLVKDTKLYDSVNGAARSSPRTPKHEANTQGSLF